MPFVPTELRIRYVHGDALRFGLSFVDHDGPIGLAGKTLTAQVRRMPGAPVLATFAIEIEGEVVWLSLDDTRVLPAHFETLFDVEVQPDARTIARGRILPTPDITRDDA